MHLILCMFILYTDLLDIGWETNLQLWISIITEEEQQQLQLMVDQGNY